MPVLDAPTLWLVITVLCGGVGAAKMLNALRSAIDGAELTGIVNVGDDVTLHGLRICPDLDTITYTLAGINNTETGWGLAGESWRVMSELSDLGGESWFGLGDRDLALHLYRTQRLSHGETLSQITADLVDHFGIEVTLLPASEDPIATRFETASLGELSFQEYFVKHAHGVTVNAVRFDGAERATPAPGVLHALEAADRIIISPSNPLISIGPILAIPAIRACLERRRADVVAVSPLIGGKALKGPADRLLDELGHSATSAGVAALYRSVAATLIIDEVDAEDRASVEAAGMSCIVAGTIMSDPVRAKTLAQVVLDV